MKHYPEYPHLDLVQQAKDLSATWKLHETFARSVQNRAHGKRFVCYEGPPSANGVPGIHHVLSRTLKDLFCRYKTMQGYCVPRKSGWDAHGLPVELQVEQELGITKAAIGQQISIQAYNQHCQQAVMRYKAEWETLTERMGYWIDLQDPYITCQSDYIESLWHLLQQLYRKKLLYKDYTIQPYSPAAGTGLSMHELNQPGCYKEVKDVAVTAQFRAKDTPDTYFLAWTTTPWTLPANSALAIHPAIAYVKVRTFNPYTRQPICVILAQEALSRYFSPTSQVKAQVDLQLGKDTKQVDMPWQVLAQYTGKELVGQTYEQLLPYVQPPKPAFRVIAADFVTTTAGTGIVHIAPTFGLDDWRAAQQAGIPPITVPDSHGHPVPIVDRQGRFVAAITDFADCYVNDAYAPQAVLQQPGYQPTAVRLAHHLKQAGKAFRIATHRHSYPHCWRTDKPILYYPMAAWFIRVTACKDQLIALNQTIQWHPAAVRAGRFGHWLENLVDWNLSRTRFWGTPLPIWRTSDGQEEKCIGSVQELRQAVDQAVAAGYMEAPLPEQVDLHRPYVDEIILVSDRGQKMYREPDLVDVWFDSGAMPYAQHHYPFENQTRFAQSYPADLVAEGIDQTRGWFFTLHALSVLLFGQVAFKRVIANGLVLDKQGNKMSKRLGNAVAPLAVMDQHGPDVLRWYMMKHNPGENRKFDLQELQEVKHKFFGTLHHTYQFFALYANLDGFKASVSVLPIRPHTPSDAWILSRLHGLVDRVTQAYEAYAPAQAVRSMQTFVVDDLSNWYVRLNRKRFWRSAYDADKIAAYQTLHACLVTLTQLAAPVAPFYMDKLYRDLHRVPDKASASVHLMDFPQAEQAYVDLGLEERMQMAQTIASLVHALRKKHKIKVRQPLARVLLPIQGRVQQSKLQDVEALLLREINVKSIVYVQDTADKVQRQVKPNFSRLGKRYGPKVQAIAAALAHVGNKTIQAFEQQGFAYVEVEGGQLKLLLEDVCITSKDIPGWSVAREGDITVALDHTLTPALVQEGLARELVNHIQHFRKEKGLAVQDRIRLTLATHDAALKQAVTAHEAYIMQETQALQLVWSDSLLAGKELMLDKYVLHMELDVCTGAQIPD